MEEERKRMRTEGRGCTEEVNPLEEEKQMTGRQEQGVGGEGIRELRRGPGVKDQAWRWRGPLLLICIEVGCGPSRPERTWASPPAAGMLCGRPLLAQAPFPRHPS